MKSTLKLICLSLFLSTISCNDVKVEKNITMYSNVWDEIINKANLDAINDSNFDSNITLVSSPENVVGIEDFKAYYSNFTTGFSDVEFTIDNIFGQGDNLVKHWSYKGKHTGDFFGIPATGKTVDLTGVTLVKMKDGKIAQEQDFMDNLAFMSQLGIDPFLNPANASIIQELYSNFATGNIEAVGAAMDEKIIWNEAENFPLADGNPYVGFDAILQGVFARIVSDWEYWKLNDIKLHEMTNNQILATGRYEAKYKRNGALLDLQMAHLWTLKDGKIISFQQYADTKGIADVMSK
ncbi:ester cyclase [Seonamhaeicola sp. ML3]|uniref:ester cyclase n=1 Tax=Seonamhaeicola sp. ML3 TaxID=2937786 RepID=UPI002010BE83|nr:ester cyclase [Seonamhaeicola sp. ML3]